MSNNNDNCYCCPYGGMLAVPAVISGFAMVFTWFASGDCNFFRIKSPDLLRDLGASADLIESNPSIGVGLWSVRDVDSLGSELVDDCTGGYPTALRETVDGAMRFARGMAVLAGFLAFAGFVAILMGSCIRMDKLFFKQIMATWFFVLSVLTLFFLIALRSDICQDADSCELSGGGRLAIFTAFLWLAAGGTALILKSRPKAPAAPVGPGGVGVVQPAYPPREEQPTATVVAVPPVIHEKVVVTHRADGTTTTTTEMTELRPDGTTNVRSAETTETDAAFSLT